MKTFSRDVDAYIAAAPQFARPILQKIRALYHKACPAIAETIKWGVPHFDYQGIVGACAAFKKHVSMGFWKAKLLKDPQGLFQGAGTSMAALKAASVQDLPADKVLLAYIKEAVALNEAGVSISQKKKINKDKKDLVIPEYFLAALAKQPKAQAAWDAFSYSHQKEYLEWVTQAKQEATRARRLATTLEWLAQGKSKNWKYEKC